MSTILKSFYLGLSFLFLFCANSLAQALLTTIYDDIGFYVFSAIYLPYSLTSLFTPLIGKKIGVKVSIVIGVSTYVMWQLSVATSVLPFIYIASVVNGIGSGLLWVHQGIWLSTLITGSVSSHGLKKVGLITGVFFGMYNSNGIVGSLIVMGLSSESAVKTSDILWSLFGIGCFSFILFLFIPFPETGGWRIFWNATELRSRNFVGSQILKQENPEPPLEEQKVLSLVTVQSRRITTSSNSVASKESNSLKTHLQGLFQVLKLKGYILLVPMILQVSMSIIYSYGVIPLFLKRVCSDGNSGQTLCDGLSPLFLTSGIILFYGISSSTFSVVWGKLYDWVGWWFVLIAYQLILMILYGASSFYVLGDSWQSQHSRWMIWWFFGFLSGAVDTGAICLANVTMTKHFDKAHTSFVFAWYRFIYCFGVAAFSSLNTVAPLEWIPVYILSWSLVSFCCITVFYIGKEVKESEDAGLDTSLEGGNAEVVSGELKD